MNTLKKTVLIMFSIIASGFLMFSFVTIGLVMLGVTGILMMVGLIARPFLPKERRKPCIINLTENNNQWHAT